MVQDEEQLIRSDASVAVHVRTEAVCPVGSDYVLSFNNFRRLCPTINPL